MSTHDDDTDPTGMRALLRGLPDPGPMPDDLVDRIHSSLADLGVSAVDPLVQPEDDVHVVSRGTTATRPVGRSSWWTRAAPRAAVAAVVLVGGGAVVSSQLGLGGSAGDSASTAGGAADRSSRDAAGEVAKDPTGSSAVSGPQAGQDGAESHRGTAQAGQVVLRMSDRSYTAAGLAAEVGAGLGAAQSSAPMAPLTAESPGIGPIGTEIGVRSCLVALGLPRDTAAEVDLAEVEGKPAAVVVVTLAGERTAYAVGRSCTVGNPALIAGPVTVP